MTSKETRAEAADNNKDQLARAAAMREAIRWSRDLETEEGIETHWDDFMLWLEQSARQWTVFTLSMTKNRLLEQIR